MESPKGICVTGDLTSYLGSAHYVLGSAHYVLISACLVKKFDKTQVELLVIFTSIPFDYFLIS